MKKCIIILISFLAVNFTCFAQDVFIDTSYNDTNNKITMPASAQEDEVHEGKKEKFSLFKKKNKNNKQFNYSTNKDEEIPQGYWGTLPNIKADFEYKRQSANSPKREDMKLPADNIEQDNLKEAPFNDTLFLDVIVKKEKASNYVNDIQKTKFALNSLKQCIEQKEDIQRFNACVNMIDMYVKNLKTKYENSSISLKESYIDILNTTYYAKVLGNLKYDSNYYSRYIPTQQGKYSKDNIAQEEQKLLVRINRTLFLINNES